MSLATLDEYYPTCIICNKYAHELETNDICNKCVIALDEEDDLYNRYNK